MKNIELLKKNSKKYSNIIIQKKFFSKKNTVAYVLYNDKPRILKWFAPGFKNQIDTEFFVLKKGARDLKIKIPDIYELDNLNNVIIMNYINGKNLCDIINDQNENLKIKSKIIIELASWFKKFHSFYSENDNYYIRGDSILRNFIFKDGIWGLDFEEFRKGDVKNDIADLCSSILTTDPKYTDEKYELCRLFIENYSRNLLIDYISFSKFLSYSILKTMMQRGLQFSKKDADEKIKKIFLNY